MIGPLFSKRVAVCSSEAEGRELGRSDHPYSGEGRKNT